MGYNTKDITDTTASKVANGLGWASVAIGLTELIFPHRIERLLGISKRRQHTSILQTMGVRELMHGIDILSHRDPTAGVWARVAGDVLDVALLGIAAKKTRDRNSFATTAAMVLGIGILDLLTAERLGRKRLSRAYA